LMAPYKLSSCRAIEVSPWKGSRYAFGPIFIENKPYS
jgi:hypothetical protein